MNREFSRSWILPVMCVFLFSLYSCSPAPKYTGSAPARRREPPEKPRSGDLTEKPFLVSSIRFLLPVRNYSAGRINSRYGIRRHPRYHTSEFHTGIDIKAAVGEAVLASASGRVTFAGRQSGYGKMIIIDHGGRLCSVYAHLSEILVPKGSIVEAGQVIGRVGMTGNSTGSHLHFEIRKAGKAVNPLEYIR